MMLHPHMVCLGNNRALIWNFVLSDLLIAIAYLLLSASLVFMVRNKQVPFKGFFKAFAAFIFLCACTHAAHIYTMFWTNGFWMSASINDVTAGVSCAVAVAVIVALPDIISFLRDRAHNANLRVERYQDTDQFLNLSSHLQTSTQTRAERMSHVFDRHADIR